MGSRREAADIHYWITDQTGEKRLDKKDTIRTEFWGSAFTGSVGQLAHPFADKIGNRIRDAKLKVTQISSAIASNRLYINDLEECLAALQVLSSSFAFREMS